MKLESKRSLFGLPGDPSLAQPVNARYGDPDAQRSEIKADINAWIEHLSLSLSQAENDSI